MKPHRLPAVAVLLLVVFLAGCGGDDDGGSTVAAPVETTTTPTGLTKDELIAQGDAICAEVNAAVGALGVESAEAAVPDTIETSADLYIGMVERLQDLGTPEDDDGSYAKFMEATEEFAKVEGEVKLATEREDPTALGAAATEAAPALEEFHSQAGIYGFEECSEEASAPTPGAGTDGVAEESAEEPSGEAIEEEAAPEEVEPAPETGGEEEAGGGAGVGGGTGGGTEGSGGGSSGGIGPG